MIHIINREYNGDNYTLACIRHECFTKNSLNKLHARASGPFCIVRKLGLNSYVLDLLMHLNII